VWVWWVVLALILHILDVVTTYIGLSRGLGTESNPFFVVVFSEWGLGIGSLLVLVIKIIYVAAGGIVCWIADLIKDSLKKLDGVPYVLGWILMAIIYSYLGFDLVSMVLVVWNNFKVILI
jgi:hypothetical protein